MNRRFVTSLILFGAFTLCAGTARGQEAPPRPPAPEFAGGPGGGFPPGPPGERMELLGFGGMHGGKVVTGAPFSAVALSETTQTLADGNHITRKTQTSLFRDSQGRFRKEGTVPAFGPLASAGQPKSFVFVSDPVAGSNFLLHPENKTAETTGKGFGRMKGAMKEALKNKAQGRFQAREQEEIANGTLKKEDLGTQTINGVVAQGTRLTKTIPAGQIGNEKPITIVHETWYSNDLQMVVMSKRSDPWSGETTYSLTNIQRTEPNASLFTVPSDYTVKQGGPRGRGMRRNQTPPPAPREN
ncbi:MAG TPA: hypothetical protein VE263_10800 [Candidatus Angelobacter sp.]|nr:hypothetical protein [Candidatus Angelobacter sp.]